MPPLPSIAQSASQYKFTETSFAANATVQQAVGANPNRVAILFSDSAGSVFIGTDPTKLGTSKGAINLSSTLNYFSATFEQYGPWVQAAWFCCRVSGISTLTVTEIIYSPSG